MRLLQHLLEHNRYYNFFGIAVILSIAWLLSHKRSHINFYPIISGLTLQFLIGFCVLKTNIGRHIVATMAAGVGRLYQCAETGSSFVFGNLCDPAGAWGFIFAVKVLPVIVFFGAFTAVLFHFSLIQRIVGVINYVLQPLLGTSGPETLCAIANSFLGQTEAPLLVRQYLNDMTTSELFVVMVSGMATISGAILVVFVAMGVPATHLLASSVMSIPGSLVIAKMLYPETEKTAHRTDAQVFTQRTSHTIFDAIFTGTSDGLQLAFNVGAMLIVFLAFLAGINSCIGYLSLYIPGITVPLSMEKIIGFVFAPLGYLLGFTGQQALQAGELIGTKIAVNELVAYSHLIDMHLPARMTDIMTYALCGFSNFSCIGIQVGGIGALAPQKRHVITRLGLYAVLAGALTNSMSAMIAAILI